jgi:hypothetical protein
MTSFGFPLFLIMMGLASIFASNAMFYYVKYHRERADHKMLRLRFEVVANAYSFMYNALTDYHLTMDHLPCNIPEDALKQMREQYCKDFSHTIENLKVVMDRGVSELYEGQHITLEDHTNEGL